MNENPPQHPFCEIIDDVLLALKHTPLSATEITNLSSSIRKLLQKAQNRSFVYFLPESVDLSPKSRDIEDIDEKRLHKEAENVLWNLSGLESIDFREMGSRISFARSCSEFADVLDALACRIRNYII